MMTRTSSFFTLTIVAIGLNFSRFFAIGHPMNCFGPMASSKVAHLGPLVPREENGLKITGPAHPGLASDQPVADVRFFNNELRVKNLIDRAIDVTFYNLDTPGSFTLCVPPNGLKTEQLLTWLRRHVITAEVEKIYDA